MKTARFLLRTDIDHYFDNPETSDASLMELTASGPLFNTDVTYFSASEYRSSNTRWNTDFLKFEIDPALREFNNITKLGL